MSEAGRGGSGRGEGRGGRGRGGRDGGRGGRAGGTRYLRQMPDANMDGTFSYMDNAGVASVALLVGAALIAAKRNQRKNQTLVTEDAVKSAAA
eukprot:CAMPEP_0119008678 /NCGR_PEP_ID=MMETSP1176-20130426/3863_1 /TAXON_ID=265551 /ORGANISM="Synedropsis recta cf, Strain CCMP1620" /LENGTH=92 /DNA_ID=CAMNT_0006961061 /DNA_START=86 /DNA_END=361 /DNA_ORIENTATION=+